MAAGSIVRAPINEPLFEVLDTLDAFVANLNYVNEFFDALAVHEAFAARNVAQLTNPFNLSNVRYCGRWDTAVSYIHDFFTLLENIGAVHNQMKERLNTLRCCSNSLKNYILKYRCLQVDCDEQFQQQLNVTIRTLRKTRVNQRVASLIFVFVPNALWLGGPCRRYRGGGESDLDAGTAKIFLCCLSYDFRFQPFKF